MRLHTLKYCRLGLLVAMVIIGGFVVLFSHPRAKARLLSYRSGSPELTHVSGRNVRLKYGGSIPRRLHQTYKEDMIPVQYRPYIESWLVHQPDWEFYFWTDQDAMAMIRERYPEYSQMVESYDHGLMKSDAIRYFVLHQFGGVYADLDMHSLRPLETLLQSETCILTPEPEVQTRLLFSYPWTLTNCIMACAANHPFLTYLLKGLEKAKKPFTTNMDVLYSTGPFFLNRSYIEYRKLYPDCKGGTYCMVNVTEGRYLVPVPDVERLREGRRQCMSPSLTARFTELQHDACRRLENTDNWSSPPPEAYTDHKWTHVGWFPSAKREKVNIRELIPSVKRYRPGKVKTPSGQGPSEGDAMTQPAS